MPEETRIPTPITRASTHIKTSTRGRGKRLTRRERAQAQATFIKAYTLNGNIMLSCKQANIDRDTFYQWQEHDLEFSVQYHQAEKNFADFALAEFRKRAMEGYEKPVISMGRVVFEQIPLTNDDGTAKLDSKGKQMVKYGKPMMERVVSDNLLAMLIKRHFPEYREKSQVDINTQVQQHQPNAAYAHLSNDELDELERLLQLAEERMMHGSN